MHPVQLPHCTAFERGCREYEQDKGEDISRRTPYGVLHTAEYRRSTFPVIPLFRSGSWPGQKKVSGETDINPLSDNSRISWRRFLLISLGAKKTLSPDIDRTVDRRTRNFSRIILATLQTAPRAIMVDHGDQKSAERESWQLCVLY